MKKKLKVIYNMIVVVNDFLAMNDGAVSSIHALKPMVVQFSGMLERIQTLEQELEKHPQKPAAAKDKLQYQLNALLVLYSAKHVAYAISTENPELEQRVTFSKTDLKRKSLLSRLNFAKTLYELNQQNLADLAVVGITADTQAGFLSTIQAFEAALPKAREHTSSVVVLSKEIQKLIMECSRLLATKIDKLVWAGMDSHPEFVAKYQYNRKRVQLPTSTLALKGMVTHSITGEPIRGVTIALGNTKVSSTIKGNFQVAHHEAGVVKIEFSKPGFVSKTVEAVIGVPGETTMLNIGLDSV